MQFLGVVAFLLFFSGGLFKVFFPDVPFFHGQRLTLYISCLVLFVVFLNGNGLYLLNKTITKHKRLLFLITPVFIVSQCIAMYMSMDVGCDFINSFFALLVLLASILIHGLAVFYVLELGYLYVFGVAWLGLFCLDMIVVLIQILYQLLPTVAQPMVDLYSLTLEARWSPEQVTESIHRFYQEDGSYVKTTFRISGLTEEAPTHAIFISVAFLPLAFSVMFSNYAFWRKDGILRNVDKYLLALILFLTGFALIASSSSTAILYFAVAVLSILMMLVFLREKLVKYSKFLSILFLLGGGAGFIYLDFIKELSANRVREAQYLEDVKHIENNNVVKDEKNAQEAVKDITGRGTVFYVNKIKDINNASTNSRLAMTLVDLGIFSENILLGVGRGCSKYYIKDYLPDWTKDNFEMRIWENNDNKYPILNQWTNLIAEIGVFGILLLIWMIYLVWSSVLYLLSKKGKNKEIDFWHYAIVLFFLSFFIGMLTSLYWRQSIYLQILFVLLWVKEHRLENK